MTSPPSSESIVASATPADEVQTVFVATTKEALNTDWFTRALELAAEEIAPKHPGIDLLPWTAAFKPGDITVSKLLSLATELVGAVVLLTSDDQTKTRGKVSKAPRDNLILEVGLFLGRLSLGNVLLLREEGSKWPSDLLGVTPKKFSRPPANREGSADITAKAIAKSISEFVDRLPDASSPASRALRRTIAHVITQAEDLSVGLDSAASNEPFNVPTPESAYVEAVKAVTNSFATTTYLGSDFWTSREINTLAANQQMLRTIQSSKGVARRLILLDRPVNAELEVQRKIRSKLRSADLEMLERMDQEFQNLAEANTELTDQGFEVKVVFDSGARYKFLPAEIKQEDIEFALYDQSRLDIFSGFTSNGTRRLRAYLDGHFSEFSVLYKAVEGYFEHLWNSEDACDFADFATRMNSMIVEVGREIDYTPNWLSRYDAASGADGALKDAESEFVLGQLTDRYRDGNGLFARGHIDLGTCTGRYLRVLCDLVGKDQRIVGIDNDQDCLDVLSSRKEKGELDSRVEVRWGDIRDQEKLPDEKFGLVTCMMGTLCHLDKRQKGKGESGSARYDDEWQLGLDNVRYLLADDGDAFIAVWNKEVCDRQSSRERLLSIYEPRDSERLCTQTPSPKELEARLKQAGLSKVESDIVGNRLHVLHLRRAD